MKHPKILIVDDSKSVRSTLQEMLSSQGAIVRSASDGKAGLDLAVKDSFDLIITDIEMPELDGFGLCKELKNSPSTRGVPVIILSSCSAETDIDKGFTLGAAAYIKKVDIEKQLLGTVEKVLEKSSFQRNKTVLVVDDSASVRFLVKRGLEEAGFRITTASDGLEAIRAINNGLDPDLILSDIEMPQLDGIELCRKIRSNPKFDHIPFIVMSSRDERAMVRRMLDRGAHGYLVKPFNIDQLVNTVERLLSDQFMLVLKDKERLDNERRLMLASITSLISALEARDLYTKGHSESVSRILTGMAKEMLMSQEEIEILHIAGKLHDIGKIGVPDNILLKPGRLNHEEFDIIKKHPSIGSNILSPIPTLSEIIPVILHHHERMDGMGYPSGLKGSEIPLLARMTAVADTFDALTSDRPYRKGMPVDKALQIIEDVRNDQLCPECVDIFMTWISKTNYLETKAII